MHRLALLAVALLAAAPASARSADVDVERVTFDRAPNGSGVVVRVETSGRVPAYSIDHSGGSLELVLYRTRLSRRVAQGEAVWPVASYRVESAEGRVTLRFEVDPAAEARARPDRNSDDLLLTVTEGPPEPAVAADVPRSPVSRWPTPRSAARADASAAAGPIATVEAAPPTTGVGPITGGEPAPVVPEGAERWRLDTIVLDAGHGAHDFGARANGTSDKEVALGVVSRLGPMIERELGVNVVYTRDDDTFVELRDRGRIANREGGKLFISVHANAAGSSAARGTETFFLAPRGSSNAREVMERENSVIELESDPSAYASFIEGGDIIASLAMSAYQEESQLLARLIEEAFVRDGRHSRGVKQDNFIVLWAASMPAVLVEVGFVTNPDEARYLKSDEGLDRTARSIFEAVRAYKQTYERGLAVAAIGR